MVSPFFLERQFIKAELAKGSKDYSQFELGMEIINEQLKLLVSTRNEMIKILREFIGGMKDPVKWTCKWR